MLFVFILTSIAMVLWVLTQLLVSRMEAVCKYPFISPVIVAFQIITNFRAFGIQRLNIKFVFCILTYPPLPKVLVMWAYEIEDFWCPRVVFWSLSPLLIVRILSRLSCVDTLSFLQSTLNEHLLCATYCSRPWGTAVNESPCPREVYHLHAWVGEGDNRQIRKRIGYFRI